MIKLGLVGAGRIGRLHAENIVYGIRGAELVTVADTLLNEEMEQWAYSLGVPKASKRVEDVFSDPEIDAVLICSPSNTHEDYIMEAARNGKHIFCEKPIGSNLSKIEKALQVVEDNKVKLQIGFVRRFDHNHKKVHDAVKEGKIGEPWLVKITSRDPQPPSVDYLKTSGGIFFDMTIHDFDMARYLSGSDVVEVSACGAVLVNPVVADLNDFDTAIVTLRFENGALGVIDNCRQAVYGYDQRTEVHGSKGCVWVENDRPNTSLVLTAQGTLGEPFLWFFVERYKEAFIAEIRVFIDAIEKNLDPPVDGMDGFKAVLIARAADESAREGKPVKVPKV
ncbi:inositol 2-dehydrogenase [Thermatribacter velox]|uniref:Inositol 2-dehydrogenase n=1 Tax=Thermatribacter velox TaxID=3039681 RepID=A0ABZ2YC69_9BACT